MRRNQLTTVNTMMEAQSTLSPDAMQHFSMRCVQMRKEMRDQRVTLQRQADENATDCNGVLALMEDTVQEQERRVIQAQALLQQLLLTSSVAQQVRDSRISELEEELTKRNSESRLLALRLQSAELFNLLRTQSLQNLKALQEKTNKNIEAENKPAPIRPDDQAMKLIEKMLQTHAKIPFSKPAGNHTYLTNYLLNEWGSLSRPQTMYITGSLPYNFHPKKQRGFQRTPNPAVVADIQGSIIKPQDVVDYKQRQATRIQAIKTRMDQLRLIEPEATSKHQLLLTIDEAVLSVYLPQIAFEAERCGLGEIKLTYVSSIVASSELYSGFEQARTSYPEQPGYTVPLSSGTLTLNLHMQFISKSEAPILLLQKNYQQYMLLSLYADPNEYLYNWWYGEKLYHKIVGNSRLGYWHMPYDILVCSAFPSIEAQLTQEATYKHISGSYRKIKTLLNEHYEKEKQEYEQYCLFIEKMDKALHVIQLFMALLAPESEYSPLSLTDLKSNVLLNRIDELVQKITQFKETGSDNIPTYWVDQLQAVYNLAEIMTSPTFAYMSAENTARLYQDIDELTAEVRKLMTSKNALICVNPAEITDDDDDFLLEETTTKSFTDRHLTRPKPNSEPLWEKPKPHKAGERVLPCRYFTARGHRADFQNLLETTRKMGSIHDIKGADGQPESIVVQLRKA